MLCMLYEYYDGYTLDTVLSVRPFFRNIKRGSHLALEVKIALRVNVTSYETVVHVF